MKVLLDAKCNQSKVYNLRVVDFNQMSKMLQIMVFYLAIAGTVSCAGQRGAAPESIIVYKTNEPVQVDGLANEASWNKAEVSSDFIDIEGVRPQPTKPMCGCFGTKHTYIFLPKWKNHMCGQL